MLNKECLPQEQGSSKQGETRNVAMINGNKRMVEVEPPQARTELLKRSVLAESFLPINFGCVVHAFKSLEKDFGRIEYKDLGPRKCIFFFESVESRSMALRTKFMTEYFDEIIAYWGYKWSHSRRIWLELMGLPIHTWSKDNFGRIVEALDWKLMMLHDLTDECAFFSVARILIDCYQWQAIQEWIMVKCEEVVFDVYVKEFGAEVLNQQVHPDEKFNSDDSRDSAEPVPSKNMETSSGNTLEMEPTVLEDKANNPNVGDVPSHEDPINAMMGSVQVHRREEDCGDNNFEVEGIEIEETEGCKSEKNIGHWASHVSLEHFEPEAELQVNGVDHNLGLNRLFEKYVEKEAQLKLGNANQDLDLKNLFAGDLEQGSSSASTSCPFPPGFGPCTEEAHVHKEIMDGDIRVDNDPNEIRFQGAHALPSLIEGFDNKFQESEREEVELTRQICERRDFLQ
ncbi:hypothetical protein PIB30_065686 [Stylosanthes scabra]|uniref:DUF4283 domain-containing protein n=1 Tax=Stylosanthes scabra TaxID=79078 RepID=A0ABU6RMF5_9FABA|nr:hypothetical protein [Stylosanthes scabra]